MEQITSICWWMRLFVERFSGWSKCFSILGFFLLLVFMLSKAEKDGQSFYRKLLIRHKIDPINKCFTTCVVTSWIHGKKDWTWKMWKRGDLKWRKFGDVLASDHLFPNLPPLNHLSSFKIGPSGIFYWDYCLEQPLQLFNHFAQKHILPKKKRIFRQNIIWDRKRCGHEKLSKSLKKLINLELESESEKLLDAGWRLLPYL